MAEWSRLSPASYQLLADATYDWESWITQDGNLRWVNPAVYRFTGYSVLDCFEMDGYPLPLVVADDRESFGQLIAAGMAGSTANDVEVRLQHRNGSILYAAASWQPVVIPGAPQGLRISVRDITSRKEVEADLREREQLYRSIVDTAWEGIILLDRQGLIEFVNPRLAKLLGFPRSALYGKPLAWFFFDRSAAECWEDGGETHLAPRRLPLTFRHAEGRPIRVLVSTCPRFHQTGEFFGQLLMVIDTSEDREDSIRRPQDGPARVLPVAVSSVEVQQRGRQLERLTDLGNLTAQIAHEVNNPLAGVRNALRLLRDLPPHEGETRREFHHMIDQEIERISRTVQQMASLQSSAMASARQLNLCHEIRTLVAFLEPTSQVVNVRLEFPEPQEPFLARLPGDELRQMLHNLLMNAIEASAPGGTVRILLDQHESPGRGCIRIQDRGSGIRPADLKKLFQPFFSTKPRSSTGSRGLGLAVCHALSQSMGVTLEVESQVGHGTEFRVVFPLNEQWETE